MVSPMTTISSRRLLSAALAAAWLSACQTTPAVRPDADADESDQGVSREATRRFDEAIRSFEEGAQLKVVDWDALHGKFQGVVSEDDRFAEAHHNLGVASEKRGLLDEAAAHYRKAVERKPALGPAWENLGLVLERSGDERGAEAAYKELLRNVPDHAGARARLADLHLRSGNPSRAGELAREALLRDPKNLAALRVLVEVHVAKGEHEIARLVALRISRMDEASPEGPFLLGRVLESQGKKSAAVAQFRKAASLSASHLPSRIALARHALEERSYTEAAALYESLAQAQASSFEIRLNLGIAQLGTGDMEGALATLEAAQALRPDDVRPSFPIASILHRHANEPERALQHYRRYVSGAPIHLRPEHPVFAQMRECEQLVQFLAAARAEEEAMKRREAQEQAAAGEGAVVPAQAPSESDPDLILPAGLDPDEPEDDL